MVARVPNAAPSTGKAKLRSEIRGFGKRIHTAATRAVAAESLAVMVKSEFEKLEPDLRKIGFKLVINGTVVELNSSTSKSKGSEKSRKTKPPPFEPSEAGRLLMIRLREAEGGALDGAMLKERYHLSSATLHRRRKEFRILFWRDAKHDFHYPEWQFTSSGALLPGLQEVLQIFRSEDEWRVMRYFLTPRDQLDDRSPLELLRMGQSEKVISHAKLHEVEGSW